MADVRAYHLFIPTHRRYKVTAGPKTLPHEISLPPTIATRDVDRALAFDVPDHLRHRILRWDRYHHVYVIRQQMPLFDTTLLPLGQDF